MAHVQKRGTKWLATHKGADGRRHSKRFDRKIDATRWLAVMTVDVMARRWVDPRDGQITFGAYADTWVRDAAVRDNTRTLYRHAVKHLAELTDVPLAALTPATMRTWQRGLSERLAPSTAGVYRGVVGTILRAAVLDRVIMSNPLDGVPMPADHDERPDVHPMPVATVHELHGLVVDWLRPAVLVAAGCGLRRGEVMGLTLDRVDFLRRTMRVDRQLVGGSLSAGPTFGPLKTASSYRTVPVPQIVLDALAAHVQARGVQPGALIFTGGRGAPMTPGRFTPVWRDALVRRWMSQTGRKTTRAGYVRADDRKAYVEAHPDGSDFTFHDLRHFYASALIADGQSVKVVQARLGHKTSRETLDTYGHLWPVDEDRTRAAIDAVLGAALGSVAAR